MKNTKLKINKGGLLLEVVFALIIMLGVIVSITEAYIYYSEQQVNVHVAEHNQHVSKAVDSYVKNNTAALINNPITTINLTTLKNQGYLPQYFENLNAFGQDYRIIIKRTPNNKLETLIVTTGGERIPDRQVVSISKLIGAQGGYIESTTPSVAKGSIGAWQVPLSSFNQPNNAGHLATALFFTDSSEPNDYLHRSKIAGKPELNRMNTALDMNNQHINNANHIQSQSSTIAGIMNAGRVESQSETTTQGWFRAMNEGGLYFEKYGGGWYMTDTSWLRAYNNKNIYTAGTVRADTGIETSGRISSNDMQLNRVVTAGTACAPNGLIARDTAGATLSCQSGSWKANSPKGWKDKTTIYWNQYMSPVDSGLSVDEWMCAYTMITGKFEGGGEKVELWKSANNTWVSGGHSHQHEIQTIATCYKF